MKTGQRYQRVQHTDVDVVRHDTSTAQEHIDNKGAENEVDLGFATPPQRSSPRRASSGEGSVGSLRILKRNSTGSPRLQLRTSMSPQEGRRGELGSEGGTGDIPEQDEEDLREVSVDFVDEPGADDASVPLWSPSLQSSSFDLLDEDDEDEINLQRYHLDSPYLNNITSNSSHGGDLSVVRASYSGDTNLSSPRLTLDRTGSGQHVSRERVGSWIALVNDPSGKGGSYSASNTAPASSRPVLDAVWTYVQIIRRQARQRRAQRLLTMNSEGFGERMQYYFLTYCWDATDVGLLLVLVLLGIWMLGLVLYLGGPPKATNTTNAAEDGEEELSEGFWKHHLTNWWWALGVILFIRIVGPCLIKQHIARRRRRRHGSDQQMERYSDGAGVEFTMSKTQHDELQIEQDLQNQAPEGVTSATTSGATIPMSPIPVETEYDGAASTTIADSPQLEIT